MSNRDFDNWNLIPRYSSIKHRDDIDISYDLKFRNGLSYKLFAPIMNAAMDSVASPELLHVMSELCLLPVLHRNCSPQEQYETFIAAGLNGRVCVLSVGVHDYIERIAYFSNRVVQFNSIIISFDIAHGHSRAMKRAVKEVRRLYPEVTIMAGSIITRSAAIDLCIWGVDYVRVGIGNGSTCTTRDKTGVYVSQIEAIKDIYPTARMVADGGIEKPSDVVKCLVAGADMVMIGGIFAGTEEAPSDSVWKKADGPAYRRHRGMASKKVSSQMSNTSYVEGKEILVPYRGSLEYVVENICNGLRSAMSYIDAPSLKELKNGVLVYRQNK